MLAKDGEVGGTMKTVQELGFPYKIGTNTVLGTTSPFYLLFSSIIQFSSHHQSPVSETDETICRNNNVVMHRNANNFSCFHQLFGDDNIILTWFRIAAGMVVNKNDCGC